MHLARLRDMRALWGVVLHVVDSHDADTEIVGTLIAALAELAPRWETVNRQGWLSPAWWTARAEVVVRHHRKVAEARERAATATTTKPKRRGRAT